MTQEQQKPLNQPWREWLNDHRPVFHVDISHKNADLLIPSPLTRIIYGITDSPAERRDRRQRLEQDRRLREELRRGRNQAINTVLDANQVPQSQRADYYESEITTVTALVAALNTALNARFLALNMSLTVPIHPVATLHLQTASCLNDPTNIALAAYTVSFHLQCCQRINALKAIAHVMQRVAPDLSVTPYLTGNFKGDAHKTIGLSLTTLPSAKRSNRGNTEIRETTETITDHVNALGSGTDSQEISSGSVLLTSDKSSQSYIFPNGQVNQEAGVSVSDPSQVKETSQTKIPVIFQNQFKNVPLTLLELISAGLVTLAPRLNKVVAFRSVSSTKLSYGNVGIVFIIVRLVALRISKRNKVKNKKNSFLLIFIITQATSLSSLSIAFCSFPLGNAFADITLSILLLFFEKITPFLNKAGAGFLIKVGAGLVSYLPIITIGPVTIGPWDVLFFHLGKGFLDVVLFSFTLASSSIIRTILLNLSERTLSFFIDQFCLLLSKIYLWLTSLLHFLFSRFYFSEK